MLNLIWLKIVTLSPPWPPSHDWKFLFVNFFNLSFKILLNCIPDSFPSIPLTHLDVRFVVDENSLEGPIICIMDDIVENFLLNISPFVLGSPLLPFLPFLRRGGLLPRIVLLNRRKPFHNSCVIWNWLTWRSVLSENNLSNASPNNL